MRSTINGNGKTMAIIAICGAVLAFNPATGMAVTDHGPTTIILQTAKAKKPATFPHALHQKSFACETCHHGKDANGAQRPLAVGEKKEKCTTCHNPAMANKSLNSLKKVAHKRCKTCHKQMKKAAQKTGPTKCKGCHIK